MHQDRPEESSSYATLISEGNYRPPAPSADFVKGREMGIPNEKPQEYLEGIQQQCEDPGRYIPNRFLLYS